MVARAPEFPSLDGMLELLPLPQRLVPWSPWGWERWQELRSIEERNRCLRKLTRKFLLTAASPHLDGSGGLWWRTMALLLFVSRFADEVAWSEGCRRSECKFFRIGRDRRVRDFPCGTKTCSYVRFIPLLMNVFAFSTVSELVQKFEIEQNIRFPIDSINAISIPPDPLIC